MVGDWKIAALCTSRIYDLQVHSFIVALNEQLQKYNYALWVYALNEDLYWEEDKYPAEASVFDYISYEHADVIIIMDEKIKSHSIAQKIISEAKSHEKPVLILDGHYDGCSSVRFDFAGGFESVVRHVIEDHGVRKPVFMGGFKGNPFSEERLAIFKKVIEENGITFDDGMVSYGEFWAIPARREMHAIIEGGNLPEAVICANDIMAINVCDVLKEEGLKVPDDVIVTGFDGYDEVFVSVPGVTTVDCELTELADMTAEAAARSVSGEDCSDMFVIPRLIKNESCGCPRCVMSRSSNMSRLNNSFYRHQDDMRMLHDCVSKMITSETLKEAVSYLEVEHTAQHTERMCCVVNKDCFKPENNFFLEDKAGQEHCLVYDHEYRSPGDAPFDIRDIIPGLTRRMAGGYPLIFQALDYMNKPMGYVAYFFSTYEITEYARTANLTEMVNMGLGGYINMQYQQYLISRMAEIYKKDALTGLYNRLAFREAFDEMKNSEDNQGLPLLAVMADLDYLKTINDNLGHKAGDQAIAALADALKTACPENALCVRFGGDEMFAFIPGGGSADDIIAHIDQTLEKKSKKLGFSVTASCGSYEIRLSSKTDLQKIVEKVDKKCIRSRKRENRRIRHENF
ncbi:MAG: GGDEF domain-containing protein [Lachnospiraceae bacterium]|nr:GGDEF domain-containing protein [Lachnospiraceae bacterium]